MNYNLPKISYEQNQICQELKTNNVIIDSVAGSGKTTTIIYISKYFNTKKLLILTYNKKLQLETRQKLIYLNIENALVYTYHGFCVKHYGVSCKNDSELAYFLNQNINPINGMKYDMLLLDESQDYKPLFYSLTCKLIKDNTKSVQICILGDKNQCIYQYQKSDERYLILSDLLFNFNPLKWSSLKLSISYRLTNNMAKFLNKCVLNEKRIIGNGPGEKVNYIICNAFEDTPYKELKKYLDMGYQYSDIFVLAPSVHSEKTPCRVLANKLTNIGVPVFVPNFEDDSPIDERILNDKIIFTTFHQAKGLERKVAIVFNFDESYFDFYKKNYNRLKCPNEIYVAITRAKEKLTLIHHAHNDYFSFFNKEKAKKYAEITGKVNIIKKTINDDKNNIFGVTNLIKHLDQETIDNCMKNLIIVEKLKKSKFIKIDNVVKQKKLYEDVSDINGIGIVAYCQYKSTGNMTILDNFFDVVNNDRQELLKREDILKIILNKNGYEITDCLYLGNFWNSISNGYNFKMKQIDDYNWLNNINLNIFTERLGEILSNGAKYEYKVESTFLSKNIVGYIDCVDDHNIFEFKCVDELKDTHFLQIALYSYLHQKTFKENIKKNKEKPKWIYSTKKYKYYLYNLLNHNLYEIKCNFNNLKNIVQMIFDCKFGVKKDLSDKEFLEMNYLIREKEFNKNS